MQSLALFSDEIADRALSGDAASRPWAFRDSGRRDETFGDETIERTWPIEGNETCDRFAVVRYGHLVSGAYRIEVSAEVVAQFAHSGFHRHSMASFRENI